VYFDGTMQQASVYNYKLETLGTCNCTGSIVYLVIITPPPPRPMDPSYHLMVWLVQYKQGGLRLFSIITTKHVLYVLAI
jgi:hypothetical protein